MYQTYRDETVGTCVRKWAKQDSVYDAKDCCGCSDTEHQGCDYGESEDRIAPEAAKTVADVLNKGLKEVAGALFVKLLPCFLDPSEVYARLPVRLLRCHPGGEVCLDLFLHVKFQLFIDFTMGFETIKKRRRVSQLTAGGFTSEAGS